MFIDQDLQQELDGGPTNVYEVTYDDEPSETISAMDAYVDGDFFLFIDRRGLVASRDASTIISVDRMS